MTDSKRKVRLSVDCSPEDKERIKNMAAREGKTISEFLLGLAIEQMSPIAQGDGLSLAHTFSSRRKGLLDDYLVALGYSENP